MIITAKYMMMGTIGFAITFFGSLIGMPYGMFICAGGSMLIFLPLIFMTTTINKRRLVPFFMKLKQFEKLVLMVTERAQVWPFIFNTKHEGILQKDRIGMMEDKGTPLTWADMPISVGMLRCGVTVDLIMSQYVASLFRNRDLKSYEEAIKRYLGPGKYTEFCKKFRNVAKPDWYHIKTELHNLLKNNEPNDPLQEKILGETIDFGTFINYLLYAYNPKSSINALNAEKIQTKREEMGYKQNRDMVSWGKFIIMLVIGLIIFFVVWNAIRGSIL